MSRKQEGDGAWLYAPSIMQYDCTWHHLSWHMEGIVNFRGCSVGLETFGACVLNDGANSHVWLSVGKGRNNT